MIVIILMITNGGMRSRRCRACGGPTRGRTSRSSASARPAAFIIIVSSSSSSTSSSSSSSSHIDINDYMCISVYIHIYIYIYIYDIEYNGMCMTHAALLRNRGYCRMCICVY